MTELIPFHTHTCYSLLDALIKVEDYVKWGKENNMPALAVTEHGNLSSAIKFFKECNKNEIKPILGMEAYMTLDLENQTRDNYHLVLLAKNKQGWLNLIKLHNLSYYNFYYKNRITFDDLEKYHEGLIACSACLAGIIPRMIIAQNMPKIDEYLKKFKSIFGDDFYLELQDHRLKQQKPVNLILVQLAKKYGIKLIATNDAHYTKKEDSFAHEVLLCKQTHKKISDANRMNFETDEFYLKNTEEMRQAISYLGEDIFNQVLTSSDEIYNKVENYDILQHQYNYPTFGDKKESLQKLMTLAQEGFKKRFAGKNINMQQYVARLKYELETIYKIGFTDYFLVLYDLYKFMDEADIATGFGRGSGAGSLVLYCLYVTHLDPIEHKLLFERFINPERISAPDVDCDVEDVNRGKVIDYIEKTYTKERVCNIATYGSLTSVASFKAVASVLEMPFVEANRISQELLDTNLSLDENMAQSEELQKMYKTDSLFAQIIDVAKRLEGGIDKRGVHAAGVVISNQPLENLTPVMWIEDASGKKINCSAFEMTEIDGDLKLLKLDILGLKNLSIVKDAINRLGDKKFNFKDITFDDKKTFDLIANGNTGGVFQLESDIMKHLCREIKPTTLADLSVINAGARPGALESGLTQSFIDRRNGKEKIDYVVDGMEDYLKDTLGLFIYQENLMQLSQVMAGYTMPEADGLRKIVGKKLVDKLPKEREHFVNGCIKNGHSEQKANEVFDMIEKFGRYGFNASHSFAYSALSYVTAYLKANYSLQYMTALLNANSDSLDKLNPYIDECYRLGIDVLPPDINKSSHCFEHDEEKNAIIFGFNGIKGVGDSSIEPILAERKNGEFLNLENLLNRMPSINKSVVEALIKCGAFNTIENNPYKYLPVLEFSTKAKSKADYKKGNINYYDCLIRCFVENQLKNNENYKMIEQGIKDIKGTKKEDKDKKQVLKDRLEQFIQYGIKVFKNSEGKKPSVPVLKENEMEILGFPISHNPKKEIIALQEFIDNDTIYDIKNSKDYSTLFAFMGRVKSIKRTRNGSYFAVLTDDSDEITTFMKRETFVALESKLTQPSNYFRIIGRLNKSYAPEKFEDNFKLESIRYFNTARDSEIVLRTDAPIESLKIVLTKIKEIGIILLGDINYRLNILCGDKKYTTKIDYWIDDLKSISNLMIEYNMTVVK